MNLNKIATKKIIFVILIGILFYWALQNLVLIWNVFNSIFKILNPFILGACIAFVLNVIVNIIEKKWIKNKKKNKIIERIKRPLSITLSILILFAVIFFVIFLVIPELINTINSITTYIPGIAENFKNWIFDLTVKYPQISDTVKNINFNWNNLDQETMMVLQEWAKTILSSSINIFVSIFTGITNFIIGLIFAVYLLLQKEKLENQVKKIMQAYMKSEFMEKTLKIFRVTNTAFTNFITGQVTEACILGALCFVGMTILRMPYSLTISVLIGFTALIPIFGAFIGAGIGALLIAVQSPMLAIAFIIFIIVLQQIEGNIIYPKVVGSSVGLPGIWVMVAVTLGGSLWGITGIIVSVPLASIIYALLRENVNNTILKKTNIQSQE